MISKRLVTTAAAALSFAALAPAAAQAGAGPGDDLADAYTTPNAGGVLLLSTAGHPHIAGVDTDTSAYTTQASEPTRCSRSGTSYGKTVWIKFKAPQYGRLDATAAGFDSVISLYDLSQKTGPEIDCTDRLFGKIESFPRDRLPTVRKNHVYAVQVGGAVTDGATPGGPLTIDLELIRPDVTVGDAVLTWRGVKGGVKISSLKVDGPSGSRIIVGCVKRSCGKSKGYSVRKTVFAQRIGKLGLSAPWAPVAKANVDRSFAAGAVDVHAAAKQVFKGKKIKNGDTLFVAVQRTDEIGEIFLWRVRKGLAGTKVVGCIEPNSTKIKRLGTCTGR